MKSILKSVITGDLVDSSALGSNDKNVIYEHLNKFIDTYTQVSNNQFSIYRGDSIQGVLGRCKYALRYAVYIKAMINSIQLSEKDKNPRVDIRLSIGIGEIDYVGRTFLESDGPAFHHSGRTLDGMKKENRTMKLTTGKKKEDEKWDVIMYLLEEVIGGWTIASAETVALLLWTDNEQKASEMLGISQPAVNLRKKHAGWDAIKTTVEYFENQYARK